MLPNRANRFKAQVINCVVAKTGENKLLTFIPTFGIFAEYVNGEWIDVTNEELEITAYCYLFQKNGSIMAWQIDALKAAFGWNGSNPFELEDMALPDVQITTEFQTYEGKESIKVSVINNIDSTGGIPQRDPELRKDGALLAKFRAYSGSSSAPPKKPSVPAEAPPKSKAPRKQTDELDVSKPELTEQEVWDAFEKHCQMLEVPPSQVESFWYGLLDKTAQKREGLSSTEWREVRANFSTVTKDFIPF